MALPDKSYTACSQSSPNGLLVEYGDEIRISAEALFNRLSYSQAHDATRRQSTCWDIALYGSR